MPYTVLILISLTFSAFFTGMENAFLTSNKLRIELDKKYKNFGSGIISVFTNNPNMYIATMLVGNTIALVTYGIAVAGWLQAPLTGWLGTTSVLPVILIQVILASLLVLLTAELIPRALFRINPNVALKFFSLPALFFYIILYPVSVFSIAISNFTLRYILNTKPGGNIGQTVFGKVDLSHLVTESEQEKDEDEPETQDLKIFKNALELSNLKVRDCMIPRTEVIAMDIESPVQQLIDTFIETGLSRILIYRDNIDNVIGYVNSKDMFRHPEHIGNYLKKLPVVPETLPVNRILKSFIKNRKGIAVVLDEFGGTSGMITTEDVIEEIFGEIQDEHDTSDLVSQQVGPNVYRLSGRHEIGFLNETFHLGIPESEEYDTLAGFIIYHLKNIPGLNETIRIDNFTMKVINVSANRVELVELVVTDPS